VNSLRSAQRGPALRLLALLALAALPAHAETTIRVRGGARIEASAARMEGRLLVAGTIVDDTGRPVPNAHIGLTGMSDDGKVVELGTPEPCPAPTPTEVRKATASGVQLTGDRLGRFCTALPEAVAAAVEIAFSDPRALLDGVSRRVAVDASRRSVELRFVSVAPGLDLGVASHRLEIGARSPSPLVETSVPLPLALYSVGARGEQLIAQSACALGATGAFNVPSASLPGPGPLELAVRFAGNEALQPAETRVRLLATSRVKLALSRPPAGADPTEGVAIDVAVGSPSGAVNGGSIEAVLDGSSVGIAAVERGNAHVVARFPRRGPKATLELHYVPTEPWWLPGDSLKVGVTLLPRSPWSSLGWFALFAALAFWLVRGWRRPPRVLRRDPTAEGKRPPPAAAVVVVEPDASLQGWQGVVRDAHDEEPVPNAVIALLGAGPDPRVLARATADRDGRFELAAAPGGELRFSVNATWHTELVCPAPPLGRLRVDLVSRRRHLLARLVRWAQRRGPLGRGVGEPTPADVVAEARRAKRDDVADWASAVEAAAFGSAAVDDGMEREVLRREPADPSEPGRPPPKRAH
jgi:hypothetical protein